MRIGVDIMGGDFWPEAPVSGAILAQQQMPEGVKLVLIGDEQIILSEFERQGADPKGFEILHTDEYVGMEESPTKALVQKPASTINVGIGLVKQKELDGFVSAGNTGAMLVSSILGLGKIDGVNRPTIGVIFPTITGSYSLLCDVGANLDSKPETLYHFGILASTYMKHVLKVPNPRVSLLNIGEEANKGPHVVQAAYELMAASPLINFIGNAEGRDIYAGKADVYVCDGFTGNVVLKFSESLYEVMNSRFAGDEFIETFNFERYGGVPILGINGISIIGHGISTGKAFAKMVQTAVEAVQSEVVEHFTSAFKSIHE
ncbi:MAG TPA: phosphate acyltransferase PlsX [Bacteroidetes bacterium]|nr:phosphate acyltransferase PlsX [Bacteroidota bacterium]